MNDTGANGFPARNGSLRAVRVGVGEICVGRSPDVFETVLGSCVGIMLYDRDSGVGGLAHIMLPGSDGNHDNPAKYADTAVPELLKQLARKGANPAKVTARIAGGAKMFEFKKTSSFSDIGQKNVDAARKSLLGEKIPVAFEDVGENFGRSVKFHLDTGKVIVRANGTIRREM